MAALADLDSLLQSLQQLKAPGVTPTKVKAITALCVDNIQLDAAIVQSICKQFQNSPATHKLGVLYVVDSVTRQWVEKAKTSGQAVSKNAAPGTYAAGVQKVTDLLPHLMTDLVQNAPDTQHEKISKLLDIWQRGHTFPLEMLATFKKQLSGDSASKPLGSTIRHNSLPGPQPPAAHAAPGALSHGNGTGYAAPAVQTNLQHTASAAPAPAPAHTPAPALAPAAAPTPAYTQPSQDLLAALSGYTQQNNQTNAPPIASCTVPAGLPFPPSMVPLPPQGFVPPPPSVPGNDPFAAPPSSTTAMNELASQIVQAMSAGTIPLDQALQVLNALDAAQRSGVPFPPPQPVAAPPAQQQARGAIQNGGQQERYDQNGGSFRDRSRSPDYHRRGSPGRKSPPHRRESPTYGVYDPNATHDGNASNRHERSERGRGKGRGGRNERNDYRQRTPPPSRRQPSLSRNAHGQSKFLEWDSSLPRDNIRVLSRTLFVGGAGGSEGEIREIFSRFGQVQTCIVNQDKRHAFVKMLTRVDAIAAKEGMDNLQDPAAQAKARQTRWGVGFGPRDCSDYSNGISVIPINRLTDADRKWALTAEHGGTGGRPLEGGMVLEEPDIEIGAGVSSKAISRRVPTDSGRGGRGGYAGRGGFDHGPPRFRKNDRPPHDPRHSTRRPEQGVAVPPAVPGFGFQLPGMR